MKARLAALSGAERSSPDRLRMKHRALRSRVKELEGEVERLRSLNRQLQQATYGRRSERRCRSQRRAAAATAPGAGRSRGQQPGAPGHGRTPRPAFAGGRAGCGAAGATVCALRAALCDERCIGDAAHRGRGLGLCCGRIHRPRTRARCPVRPDERGGGGATGAAVCQHRLRGERVGRGLCWSATRITARCARWRGHWRRWASRLRGARWPTPSRGCCGCSSPLMRRLPSASVRRAWSRATRRAG